MKIQRKRINDIVSKYNKEGITSNGLVHGNYAKETQGFRFKDDTLTYYIMFNYENGKYSLAMRLNIAQSSTYFQFTSEFYYKDFKNILIDFLEEHEKGNI